MRIKVKLTKNYHYLKTIDEKQDNKVISYIFSKQIFGFFFFIVFNYDVCKKRFCFYLKHNNVYEDYILFPYYAYYLKFYHNTFFNATGIVFESWDNVSEKEEREGGIF